MDMKDKFVYLIRSVLVMIVASALLFTAWAGMVEICMFFGMERKLVMYPSFFLGAGGLVFISFIIPHPLKKLKRYKPLEKKYVIIRLAANIIRLLIKFFRFLN
jgi:hypothetical protein